MGLAIPPGEQACRCGSPEPSPSIASGEQRVPVDAWIRCIKCWGLF